MEITEITVTLRNEEKIKAFVNVTFDNQFVIRGMKIIKGATGYFVSMPSRKMSDGSFRDIAHPVNNEFRSLVEKIILKEYSRKLELEDEDENVNSNEVKELLETSLIHDMSHDRDALLVDFYKPIVPKSSSILENAETF